MKMTHGQELYQQQPLLVTQLYTPQQAHHQRNLYLAERQILNTKFETNWEVICKRKQHRIDYNNKRENAKRINHEYQINDKVLLRDPKDINNKFGNIKWEGPYQIVSVNKTNGTVYLRKGVVTQPYNIRKIKPFKE